MTQPCERGRMNQVRKSEDTRPDDPPAGIEVCVPGIRPESHAPGVVLECAPPADGAHPPRTAGLGPLFGPAFACPSREARHGLTGQGFPVPPPCYRFRTVSVRFCAASRGERKTPLVRYAAPVLACLPLPKTVDEVASPKAGLTPKMGGLLSLSLKTVDFCQLVHSFSPQF